MTAKGFLAGGDRLTTLYIFCWCFPPIN